ncbi:unnamed protein product, partial [Musa banksii]
MLSKTVAFSLLFHAQERIHIGNHGIPLLHNDAFLSRHDCSMYHDCDIRGPCTNIAECRGRCQAAGYPPRRSFAFLIDPAAIEAQFAAALRHDDLGKPISLFSHAQQRIHIGNNGIPLLHNDAHSPSCMPRHDCSIYQYVIVLILTFDICLCVLL